MNKRRLLAILGLALLILFFLGGWALRNKLAADRQGEWTSVQRGDLASGVDVTGSLAAEESDAFGPPQIDSMWNFKISMMAPEGADVKAGQPVLAFDASELQKRLENYGAERDQATTEIEKKRADLALRTKDERLRLAEAEATLRKTSLKLEAPSDLTGIKERKQAEVDHALAKREAASIRSRISSLEAAAVAEIRLLESKQKTAAAIVAQTQDAIQRMTIRAPRAGTLVYVTSQRGSESKKKVGDAAWRSERIIEIPNLTKMLANGEIDEVDTGRIAVGQRVSLRLDSQPDEEFTGTIIRAGRTVQQKQATKNPVKALRIVIRLDRTDPAKMRPGMRFRGTVELSRVKSALLIPRGAVFVTDSGPVAYRRGLLSVDAVPLKLGRENAEFVEVVGGLTFGDRVLVAKESGGEESRS